MQIVSQISQKRLQLFCDGSLYRELDLFLFRKKIPSVHEVQSLEERERWMRGIEEKVAFDYAVSLLARQDYLSLRLEERLDKKGISLFVIKQTVEKLQTLGYLQDARLVKRMIEKERAKGQGPGRILGKLRSLQIDPHLYEKELQELYSKGYQRGKIQELIVKEKRKGVDSKKIARALYRKGFSFDEIRLSLFEKEEDEI